MAYDVLPKKSTMARPLRFLLLLGVGTLLAGGIFYGFYAADENIEAGSTGFNASSKGLFGWDYSFAEHTFRPDGDAYRAVLIDSGSEIRFGRLFAEILLCLGLGWGTPFAIWATCRVLIAEPGEQAAAPNRLTRSESDIHRD